MVAIESARPSMLGGFLWPLLLSLPVAASALIARNMQISPPPGSLVPGAAQIFPLDIVLFVFGWWAYLLYTAAVRLVFLRLQADGAIPFRTQFSISAKAAFGLVAAASFLRCLNYLWPVQAAATGSGLFYARVFLNVALFLGAYLLEARRYVPLLKAAIEIPPGRAFLTWFAPVGAMLLFLSVMRFV